MEPDSATELEAYPGAPAIPSNLPLYQGEKILVIHFTLQNFTADHVPSGRISATQSSQIIPLQPFPQPSSISTSCSERDALALILGPADCTTWSEGFILNPPTRVTWFGQVFSAHPRNHPRNSGKERRMYCQSQFGIFHLECEHLRQNHR